eukprot:2211670-Pleurochrysis_carterae.AAC.2
MLLYIDLRDKIRHRRRPRPVGLAIATALLAFASAAEIAVATLVNAHLPLNPQLPPANGPARGLFLAVSHSFPVHYRAFAASLASYATVATAKVPVPSRILSSLRPHLDAARVESCCFELSFGCRHCHYFLCGRRLRRRCSRSNCCYFCRPFASCNTRTAAACRAVACPTLLSVHDNAECLRTAVANTAMTSH